MEKDDVLNKLDALLELFREQNDGIQYTELFKLANKDDLIFKAKVLKISLEKLLRDKYVYEFINRNDSNDIIYTITIEGIIFCGYVEQDRINVVNQTIFDQNETRIIRNEKWLIRGTWFAGFAGLLLLLWQIFLYFYPVHADYPYFFWQTIKK
jgi:hypothetical protein